MPASSQRAAFVKHLQSRGLLAPEQAGAVLAATRDFREAVAAIAVRNALLDPLQIDEILEEVDEGGFALAAVRLGLLSAEQAELLSAIQGLRELVEICEHLVLSRLVEPAELWRTLAGFMEAAAPSNARET